MEMVKARCTKAWETREIMQARIDEHDSTDIKFRTIILTSWHILGNFLGDKDVLVLDESLQSFIDFLQVIFRFLSLFFDRRVEVGRPLLL